MKTCLIYPPVSTVTVSCRPPLGLAYLASVLLKKGSEVDIISSDAEGLNADKTVSRILDLSPDLVGISVLTTMAGRSLRMIENIKRRRNRTKIIVGGPHPTVFPEEFLNGGADVVVRGEGEDTLSELYDHFEGGASLDRIKGISYKEDGQFVHNPGRELIKDINTIPLPAWELFPIRRYKSNFRMKGFSLPIMSSRGCPHHCTFCYKTIHGDVFRTRKPELIVDEIAYLKDRFGIEEFDIMDDSFASDPKTAMEVCEQIISRKISLPWTLPSGIRISAVSGKFLEKLKAAGCYRIALGIESGNQRILDCVKKGIRLEQARDAMKLFKKFKMKSVGYFIIGIPEETKETIEDTIRFAIELDLDYAQFSKATPFPGTAMYDQLKSENRILARSWDDYDCFLKSRPLFMHDNLSSNEIDDRLREAYRRFFLRPKCVLKHLAAIGSFREAANLIRNTLRFHKLHIS